ncbi:MAG TPA: chemotaxis protein CheW [Gemmatimonadales bacterium]
MVQLLSFSLGELRLAIPAAVVREVTRAVAITPLPKAPAVVEGVINVRGRLVPALDLRRRFDLPANPINLQQHLIIAHADARLVALRVDRVEDLTTVPDDDIKTATHIVPGAEYAEGIAKLSDGLVVIHDLARFLSLEEGGQLDIATSGAAAPPGGPPRKARRPR